jgi:hypothetical protein
MQIKFSTAVKPFSLRECKKSAGRSHRCADQRKRIMPSAEHFNHG